QVAGCVPKTHRRGWIDPGHRAQPRSHQDSGLGDRPRAGRWRTRRKGGGIGPAGNHCEAAEFIYRKVSRAHLKWKRLALEWQEISQIRTRLATVAGAFRWR